MKVTCGEFLMFEEMLDVEMLVFGCNIFVEKDNYHLLYSHSSCCSLNQCVRHLTSTVWKVYLLCMLLSFQVIAMQNGRVVFEGTSKQAMTLNFNQLKASRPHKTVETNEMISK